MALQSQHVPLQRSMLRLLMQLGSPAARRLLWASPDSTRSSQRSCACPPYHTQSHSHSHSHTHVPATTRPHLPPNNYMYAAGFGSTEGSADGTVGVGNLGSAVAKRSSSRLTTRANATSASAAASSLVTPETRAGAGDAARPSHGGSASGSEGSPRRRKVRRVRVAGGKPDKHDDADDGSNENIDSESPKPARKDRASQSEVTRSGGSTGSADGDAQVERESEEAEGEHQEDGSRAGAAKTMLYRLPELTILPEARTSRVKHAEFVKSSADVAQCPPPTLPEVAVIGRSNVGKSSLINMLTQRRDLAQTSKKPGKTQLINHFLINGSWYLVDLPGYGFAVAPNTVRQDWNAFTKKYFLSRTNLVTVLLLVDASIPPQQVDLECADWLGEHKIPVTIVFTKCDKRKKKKNGGRPPAENVADFEQQLGDVYEEAPPWVMTSSVVGMGRDTLLQHIAQLATYWKS